MATTRLADVIYGALFLPTTIQRTVERSAIRTSGIASSDPVIQQFANAPGDVVNMPFWNDISGASNVSSDDPAQTAVPNKITQAQDTARKIRRNNGWQSANLVASVLTEDPLDTIATLIADYWMREEQTILVQILDGVFAAASMSANILNVATEDANVTGVFMNADVSADAHALLGDHGPTLAAALVHSRVYYNLESARALDYGKDPVTGLNFVSWHDKRILVSDSLPRVAGATSGFKYTSYFFAAGAIGYAEATGAGGPKTPVEIEATAAAGNGEGIETVWYRRHWVMHPRGVRFSGTPAGNTPTNAELALGTNWTRVYDPKNVRIVKVVTNG